MAEPTATPVASFGYRRSNRARRQARAEVVALCLEAQSALSDVLHGDIAGVYEAHYLVGRAAIIAMRHALELDAA